MKHIGKRKNILTRECSKCGGDLADRYGKQRYCKACHAANMRATRPKHKDLPDIARMKANCRAYTHVLIKKGALIKLPCIKCGSINSEAHHEDYKKPREVIWYCRTCHLGYHNQQKKSAEFSPNFLQS